MRTLTVTTTWRCAGACALREITNTVHIPEESLAGAVPDRRASGDLYVAPIAPPPDACACGSLTFEHAGTRVAWSGARERPEDRYLGPVLRSDDGPRNLPNAPPRKVRFDDGGAMWEEPK